jgi:outer membrane protein
MNKLIRNFITLAAFSAGSTALLAQPAVKLVVVEMARVYDNHFKTEEANAKFRDAEQKAQEQVEELKKQGQTLVEEYKELVEQSKNTLLTAEARSKAEADSQKKMEDIQRKQNDMQQFLQNTQRSLQQRIKTHRDLLLEEISKVVNDIAKRNGATLVIDKSGPTLFGIPSVLYADPAYDITDAVLAEVNKDRPAPAAATPAATAPAGTQFNVPNVSEPKK